MLDPCRSCPEAWGMTSECVSESRWLSLGTTEDRRPLLSLACTAPLWERLSSIPGIGLTPLIDWRRWPVSALSRELVPEIVGIGLAPLIDWRRWPVSALSWECVPEIVGIGLAPRIDWRRRSGEVVGVVLIECNVRRRPCGTKSDGVRESRWLDGVMREFRWPCTFLPWISGVVGIGLVALISSRRLLGPDFS